MRRSEIPGKQRPDAAGAVRPVAFLVPIKPRPVVPRQLAVVVEGVLVGGQQQPPLIAPA